MIELHKGPILKGPEAKMASLVNDFSIAWVPRAVANTVVSCGVGVQRLRELG